MTASRLIRIGLVILGIWVALFLVGFWLYDSDNTRPGDGQGEPVPGLTTTP